MTYFSTVSKSRGYGVFNLPYQSRTSWSSTAPCQKCSTLIITNNERPHSVWIFYQYAEGDLFIYRKCSWAAFWNPGCQELENEKVASWLIRAIRDHIHISMKERCISSINKSSPVVCRQFSESCLVARKQSSHLSRCSKEVEIPPTPSGSCQGTWKMTGSVDVLAK